MFQMLTNASYIDAAQARPILWRIILCSLIVKLLFAVFLPLGVDEAYATAVAREFSWSFFDHPPLGFWAPVFSAVVTGIEHPFIYRLPALIFGVITSVLMYRIGELLGGARAGLWSALLYCVTPAFLLAGGVFVLPDGPLELGSAICVLALVRVVMADGAARLHDWVWVGLGLALALASKYQAGLMPIAVVAFALTTRAGRGWFTQIGPYLASLVGLIGLAPVLIWNIQNDWASLAFHSARTARGLHPDNLAQMLAGQLIYLLPPVLVLGVIGLRRGLARHPAALPEARLVALVALTPIVAFNVVYLFSQQSFPHWTLPGWHFTLPLAALWLSEGTARRAVRARRWLIGFAVPIWAILLVLLLHISAGILTRFSERAPTWDRTENVFNYSDLRPALAKRGLIEGLDLIVASNWIQAGLLSTGMQGDWPVRVLSTSAHHFEFMSGQKATGHGLFLSATVLPLAQKHGRAALAVARKIDPDAEMLDPVVLNRGGIPYVAVAVVRVTIP